MAGTRTNCKNCFDPLPEKRKHPDFCHMCYLDLFKPDGRMVVCMGCEQLKTEYEDFLCKECWELEAKAEEDYGDAYAFNKDI